MRGRRGGRRCRSFWTPVSSSSWVYAGAGLHQVGVLAGTRGRGSRASRRSSGPEFHAVDGDEVQRGGVPAAVRDKADDVALAVAVVAGDAQVGGASRTARRSAPTGSDNG